MMPFALGLYLSGILIMFRDDYINNLLIGLGRLMESIFQLLFNTISFMRVGIFALAHIGMSSAINQIGALVDNSYLQVVMLIIGHFIIIMLNLPSTFIRLLLVCVALSFSATSAAGWTPDSENADAQGKSDADVAQTIATFKTKDPGLKRFFSSAMVMLYFLLLVKAVSVSAVLMVKVRFIARASILVTPACLRSLLVYNSVVRRIAK